MTKQISEAWLDRKWSEVIRLLFSGKCAKCHKCGLQAHHIVGRRNRAFRWHPLNGVLLCLVCHRWAHDKPKEFAEWLRTSLKHQHQHCVEDFHKNNVLTSNKESGKTLLEDTEEMLTKRVIGRGKR